MKHFFASSALTGIVLAIGEWLAYFVRMERKYIPQEYSSIDLIKHALNNRCRPLGDGRADRWPFSRKIPALGVSIDMNIVSQRKAGSSSSPIPKISTNT